MITFTVRGLPAPQGSKRAFRNKHSGRIQQVESSKRVAPWRSDIRDAAEREMRDHASALLEPLPPLTGPVAVELAFRWPRPKAHLSARGGLRPSAPVWPATLPDLDKLARAVLDALTGIVWVDDAQVVDLGLRKRYADGEGPGVTVAVRDLTERAEGTLGRLADVVRDGGGRLVGIPGLPITDARARSTRTHDL